GAQPGGTGGELEDRGDRVGHHEPRQQGHQPLDLGYAHSGDDGQGGQRQEDDAQPAEVRSARTKTTATADRFSAYERPPNAEATNACAPIAHSPRDVQVATSAKPRPTAGRAQQISRNATISGRTGLAPTTRQTTTATASSPATPARSRPGEGQGRRTRNRSVRPDIAVPS